MGRIERKLKKNRVRMKRSPETEKSKLEKENDQIIFGF
jgi:hypothetical protein